MVMQPQTGGSGPQQWNAPRGEAKKIVGGVPNLAGK